MMAQQDILIGIDAGTSVIKTVAFDLSGQQIAVAAVPNRYVTRPDGAAVQDMNDTGKTRLSLCGSLSRRFPVSPIVSLRSASPARVMVPADRQAR